MKSKYFKKYYDCLPDKIMSVAKVTEKGALKVTEDEVIKFRHLLPEFYEENGYKKSSAKEFDHFLTDTLKSFDEILNP